MSTNDTRIIKLCCAGTVNLSLGSTSCGQANQYCSTGLVCSVCPEDIHLTSPPVRCTALILTTLNSTSKTSYYTGFYSFLFSRVAWLEANARIANYIFKNESKEKFKNRSINNFLNTE